MKCETAEQHIHVFDVTSLYPAVNALDEYAVGFKKYVITTPEQILSGQFIGLVKCDFVPPTSLHVPVLPDRKD
eukprot:4172728-Heterocapsa_arctica.AAC.1